MRRIRRGTASAGNAEARVAAIVARDGAAVLRVAQQWSLCRDDALDAYQRALEIYLRRLESVDPATEGAWLKVVVKHEALAIRRTRQQTVAPDEPELDAQLPAGGRGLEEQVESLDRVRRSAEALRQLKPDEARALLMKANGLSYEEIGERCGWSYTKVNRCITEGRRRFMEIFESIATGAECLRLAPIVEALVGGTATGDQLVALRPHLRNCAACRATVKALHLSKRDRLALLGPLALASAPLHGLLEGGASAGPAPPGDLPLEQLHQLTTPAQTAGTDLHPLHTPDIYEALERGREIPGQIAARADDRSGLLQQARTSVSDLVHRFASTDLVTSAQLAAGSGGGRITALAAAVGICLSSAGAATVCVVAGVLPDPTGLTHRHHEQIATSQAEPHRSTVPVRRLSLSAATPTPRPTPTATPTPRHRRRTQHRKASTTRRVTPTSHEQAPASPAPTGATQDFALEQSAPQSKAKPAAAPPTGGGEFTP